VVLTDARVLRLHGERLLQSLAAAGLQADMVAVPDGERSKSLATFRTIAVMNGDLLSGVDLGGLFAFHREHQADLTIATHAEHHRLKLGEVVTGPDHRVVDYVEKPVKEYRISSGIYLVEPPVLRLLERREWLGFPELARRAIGSGLRVIPGGTSAARAGSASAGRILARPAARAGPSATSLRSRRP
jgi:hypothetical protein